MLDDPKMSQNPNNLSRFWKDLKRRKVVHVIVVYASAAFVIIELVNNVYETLRLPEWTPALTLIILAIGFPLAIVFSWIFDVTPRGIEKTRPLEKEPDPGIIRTSNSWRIATYISLVVIIGLIVFQIAGRKSVPGIDESLQKSIAVLPFQNFSTEPDQDPMCLGLTDQIINQLYKIKSFDKVVSLTSVLNYRNPDRNTPEIAKELGVNYILEGVYKKIGDQLSVSAQLIEPANDRHIWVQEFNRPYEEIITLQSEIALQIAEHLKAFLSDAERKSIERIPTQNREAYELEQKLRYMFYTQAFESMDDAIEILQQAIELDPEYATAYAWAGAFTLYKGNYSGDEETRNLAWDALSYVERALELDPENAPAHLVLGHINDWVKWDYIAADKAYTRALELEPNNTDFVWSAGEFYIKMNRFEKTSSILSRVQMDERTFHGITSLETSMHILSGNRNDAIDQLNKTLVVQGNLAYKTAGELYLWLGSYDSARTYLEKAIKIGDPEMRVPRFQADLALAYYHTSNREEARTIINNLITRGKTSSAGSPNYFTGWYYSWISKPDSAFLYLEKAYQNRSPEMPWLKMDPAFNNLKNDPRYWDLYERTGHQAYDDHIASRSK